MGKHVNETALVDAYSPRTAELYALGIPPKHIDESPEACERYNAMLCAAPVADWEDFPWPNVPMHVAQKHGLGNGTN